MTLSKEQRYLFFFKLKLQMPHNICDRLMFFYHTPGIFKHTTVWGRLFEWLYNAPP